MADILNIPNCGVNSSGNSGVDVCDVIRKTLKGIILTDPNFQIAAGSRVDLNTFMAYLDTATTAARGVRIYPIPDLVNFDDKSSEATRGSLGNITVAQIDLVDAIPEFEFRHYNGEAYHKKLSRFNSQSVRIFIYDDANQLFGTLDSNNNLKGYTLAQFRTILAKFGTASESAHYPFKVVMKSAAEYRDNVGYIICDSRLSALSGIIDVINSLTSQTTNVVKVKALTEGSGTNLGDLYSVTLASVSLWVVKRLDTGATVTITSVTWDAATSSFVVTIDSTIYTAAPSTTKFTIDQAAASVLDVANVSPYESKGPVTITKP